MIANENCFRHDECWDGFVQTEVPSVTKNGSQWGSGPVRRSSRSVRLPRKRARLPAVLRAACILILLLVLFFPGAIIGAAPPRGAMTSACANGNLKSDPPSVALGSTGRVRFACAFTPSLVPAFTVTGQYVRVKPLLSGFVAPYVSLWIYHADDSTARPCSNRDGHMQVLSGRIMKVQAGNWNYCTEFMNVGQAGLPGFSLTWTDG